MWRKNNGEPNAAPPSRDDAAAALTAVWNSQRVRDGDTIKTADAADNGDAADPLHPHPLRYLTSGIIGQAWQQVRQRITRASRGGIDGTTFLVNDCYATVRASCAAVFAVRSIMYRAKYSCGRRG